MVTARGEFAVRGGIVDIFPPTAEHPVRVEFWGDEVSELRTFGVSDQRSVAAVDELGAPGCRGLLLTAPVRARAAGWRGAARRGAGTGAGGGAGAPAREQRAAARAVGAPRGGHPGGGH